MALTQVGKHRWQLEKKPGMNVPGILYASKDLLSVGQGDAEALEQIRNVACLPGIVGASLAMPDVHWGYGFPIGGVAAFDFATGVISPGGVGYDINCGVRLVTTDIEARLAKKRMNALIEGLFESVPCGLGEGGSIHFVGRRLDEVLARGSRQVVKEGFGCEEDLDHTEARGGLSEADPRLVSKKAKGRGENHLGTLGSGNHFLEIQAVEEIFDEKTAGVFGLHKGQIVVMIHSGSRGLGHQVCDDYLQVMKHYCAKHKIHLPDRQLACAPFQSREGKDYFGAMCAAANFAWANRQVIMHLAVRSIRRTLGVSEEEMGARLVYDVAHNIAKVETHEWEGKERSVVVHRKGATRAFPPGHPDLPAAYRDVGQPVLIPGDMGRASFVLVGRPGSMEQTFGSCCHGAGRVMSRSAAKRAAAGRDLKNEIAGMGVVVRSRGRHTLAEEMPEVYKNVSAVVEVVHEAGLAAKVARLRPLGVIKG